MIHLDALMGIPFISSLRTYHVTTNRMVITIMAGHYYHDPFITLSFSPHSHLPWERLEKTETTREKKSSLHLTHTLSKLICTKIEDLPIRSSPKLPLITLIKWLPNFYPTLILFYDFSSTPTLLLALESLYSLMKLVNKKESYWFGQKILSIENSFLFSVETACPSRRKGELIKCILVIWNNLWLFYHMK